MKKILKYKRSKPLHIKILLFILIPILLFQIFYFPLFQREFNFTVLKVSDILANVIYSDLISETNDYRLINEEESLEVSDLLMQAAQMKADDMAKKGYFSHVSPDGEKPWSWFNKVDYKYEYAGENLAIDFSESADITKAWISSAKHKANLLNTNFTEIGVGISKGMYEGHEATFVVQFFANPFNELIKPTADQPLVANLTNLIAPTVAVVTSIDFPDGVVLGIETNENTDNNLTNRNNKISLIVFLSTLFIIVFVFLVKILKVKIRKQKNS